MNTQTFIPMSEEEFISLCMEIDAYSVVAKMEELVEEEVVLMPVDEIHERIEWQLRIASRLKQLVKEWRVEQNLVVA